MAIKLLDTNKFCREEEKQGKETKYTLRLIPLGGFCSMEGEDEFDIEIPDRMVKDFKTIGDVMAFIEKQ